MSFLEEMHKPDILDCISHLSSDEVFTSPKLVNEILDTLPQELFQSPGTKFLDPCCKSGVFLREIAKRLIEGLADKIPNLEERLDHIFKNQLYGLAITELTALLSRRSVYCSKTANSDFSICKFADEQGNIEYKRTYHVWFKDRCIMCGASKSEYDRGEELETHAYSFIHTDEQRNSALFKRLKDMKFDVIIGNPPYQLSDGGGRDSGATPIYNLFVEQAIKLNPRFITMIIPARWYTGGKGLDNFREKILNDTRIAEIHDYPETADCFPGVNIRGGICYFLWNQNKTIKDCYIYNHKNGIITSSMQRKLLEDNSNVFIRYNQAISILKKVQIFKEPTYDSVVSSRKPFGLDSDYKSLDLNDNKNEKYSIKYYRVGGYSYIQPKDIPKNKEMISKIKVIDSKASPGGDDYPHQIITKPILSEQNSACSETYLVISEVKTEQEGINLIKYMCTRFFRFMMSLIKNTQNISKGVYAFVPIQNLNEEWTDEKLYKKYGLTQEEIDFIESMIRPME